jgi:hypothetical protein
MAILNITYQGLSADCPIDFDTELGDADVRRIALELVRNGEVKGLVLPDLPLTAFDQFIVDRFNAPDGTARLYLRPKVPFGARA